MLGRVNHSTQLRQLYKNETTGEEVNCNTNKIEGAWTILKSYFRKRHGVKIQLVMVYSCTGISNLRGQDHDWHRNATRNNRQDAAAV